MPPFAARNARLLSSVRTMARPGRNTLWKQQRMQFKKSFKKASTQMVSIVLAIVEESILHFLPSLTNIYPFFAIMLGITSKPSFHTIPINQESGKCSKKLIGHLERTAEVFYMAFIRSLADWIHDLS